MKLSIMRYSSVTSSLLDPNVSLNVPFSNTSSLFSALSVRDTRMKQQTRYGLGQNIVYILYLSLNLYPKSSTNLDTYIQMNQPTRCSN